MCIVLPGTPEEVWTARQVVHEGMPGLQVYIKPSAADTKAGLLQLQDLVTDMWQSRASTIYVNLASIHLDVVVHSHEQFAALVHELQYVSHDVDLVVSFAHGAPADELELHVLPTTASFTLTDKGVLNRPTFRGRHVRVTAASTTQCVRVNMDCRVTISVAGPTVPLLPMYVADMEDPRADALGALLAKCSI